MKRKIDVCVSPLLFRELHAGGKQIIVVVDVLRATTSICTAFAHGAKEIIPVKELERARELQQLGYPVAAERDGKLLEFAEYGNSPFTFMQVEIKDKTIVYCTTNGTMAIDMAGEFGQVVLGGFCNITALKTWLLDKEEDILLLCSGWKGTLSLEDMVFAGALISRLEEEAEFEASSDAVPMVVDLYKASKRNIQKYLSKALHHHRLVKLGYEKDIEFALREDTAPVVPVLIEGRLVPAT